MYGKKRQNRKRASKPLPYKRRAYKVSKNLNKAIKKVIHSQIENKTWTSTNVNTTIVTASSSALTYFNLLPILIQGTGAQNRIGNEVRVRRAYIKGRINILPYNVTTNPLPASVLVKMWVVREKLNNNSNQLQNSASNFFTVNSAPIGPTSTILDTLYDVNTDYYSVFATRTIELSTGWNSGTTYTTPTGSKGSFTVPFYFNLTKHVGLLKWNDTSPTYTTNKNLFLVFQAVYSDGSSTALNSAEYHCCLTHHFEDA